jgi:hypothetical protein
MNDAESEHSTPSGDRRGEAQKRLADNPPPTTRQRRSRGRPRSSRWDLFRTCVMTDSFRRLVLGLAQQAKTAVPEAKFRDLMEREEVPAELWGTMRAAIGRHLHHRDAPGLNTAMQRRGLAMLTLYLAGKPRELWDQKDRRRDMKRETLMAKHYGPEVIDRINDSTDGGTSVWRGGILSPKAKTPEMMRGPWGAFDQWGADHLRITVKTFRNRRAAFLQSDDPLAALLQPTPAAQRRPKKSQNRPH